MIEAKNRFLVCFLLAFLLPLLAAPKSGAFSLAAAPALDKAVEEKIDKLMSDVYQAGQPGAAVLVRLNGETVYRKAFGSADLELGVPMAPDMVFRLGSITKQFTAVAILMLAGEGKLSLQDDVSKFLPDLPLGGRKVTVENLLTHTSGLSSYTNQVEWLKIWRQDLTVSEIIELTKNKRFEFDPGARWRYSNTGYVVLGAIIEKVSGQTYEAFVQERIFKPLGMNSSCYGSTERVIARRVPGYSEGTEGFRNAAYLSMTQPHAAGALLSTVDDMAVWNDAVFSGKLVKKELLDKAFTPAKTADGESTGYGYGWFLSQLDGRRTVEHGGGINGFASYGLALPDDRLYIVVLTNSDIGGLAPGRRAERIAELVLGLKPAKREAVALGDEEVKRLCGVYENAEGQARYITWEKGSLVSQRAGGPKVPVTAVSPTEFAFPESVTVLRFSVNGKGEVEGLRLQARLGPAEVYRKTDKPLPVRKGIKLEAKLLERCAGEYELMPGFSLVFTVEDGRLMCQPTGQPKTESVPESETKFFFQDEDVQLEFDLGPDGRATGMTMYQGGLKVPGKKIK